MNELLCLHRSERYGTCDDEAEAEGQMMPVVPALRISRPHSNTQYCYGQAAKTFDFSLPPDGRCFTKHRLSGLNNRKRYRRFPGSSAAVIAMTAIPPRRAHGTLQPSGMKVS